MFRKLFFQATEKALQVSKKSQKSLLVNQMVCEEFALYFILINQILYEIIRNQLKQPIKSASLLVTAPLILSDKQGILHFQTLL